MNYHINLTAEDIALIGIGLGKLPYEQVSNLIGRFQAQIAANEAAAIEAQKATAGTGEPVAAEQSTEEQPA